MKTIKNILTGLLIGFFLAAVITVGAIEFQSIPGGVDMSATMVQDNFGEVVDYPVIMTFSAITNSSGIATIYLTDDRTVEGGPMLETVYAITATARNNTSNVGDIPLVSTKLLNGITVTLNVVNSNTTLLTGQGLEFVPVNVVVDVIVIGSRYGY